MTDPFIIVLFFLADGKETQKERDKKRKRTKKLKKKAPRFFSLEAINLLFLFNVGGIAPRLTYVLIY